jgi:hypothetical protein
MNPAAIGEVFVPDDVTHGDDLELEMLPSVAEPDEPAEELPSTHSTDRDVEAALVEEGHLDRRADVLQVVCPGDIGGWSQLVMLSLGLSDSIIYDGLAVRLVEELQEANDLEVDGIVRGETWAYVLPELKVGKSGIAVTALCRLTGAPVRSTFSQALADHLGTDVVRREDWLEIIRAAS